MYKYVPNILSVSRMFLCFITLGFIFQPVVYIVLYVITVLTDTFDGLIARKYHLESETGALLDSIADHLLYLVIVISLLLAVELPSWSFVIPAVVIIVVTRGANCIISYVRFGKTRFIHTIANKVAGFTIMAATPFFVFFGVMPLWALIVVTVLSTIAALEETLIFLKSKECDVDCLSIFSMKKE